MIPLPTEILPIQMMLGTKRWEPPEAGFRGDELPGRPSGGN